MAAGDVVVPAGVRLGPAQLGALAAVGVAHVVCARRPRVGDARDGQRARASRRAARARAGLRVERSSCSRPRSPPSAPISTALPVVADDESAHRAALERGLAADVLVTSGGVSVGPHDLVRAIEAELGVEEVFWRVAIKPGKPVSFGVRGATLVFGLPGNPVSSLVGCELFVKPALRALQGLRDPLPRLEPGVLASPLRRNDARDEFVRARSRLDRDGVVLEPLSGQESHMIVRAAAADALVHVPRGDGELAAGLARDLDPARRRLAGSAAREAGCTPAAAGAARARACGCLAKRAARRPLRCSRIGRVPSAGERDELPRAGCPRERDHEAGQRRVPEREEPGDVPRRVEAEPVAVGERPEQERRARRTRRRGRHARAQSGLSRTCGSQSQMCSDGSRKMSANGFVATTSSATTPSASSAAAWPASSSSGRTSRRGSSRSRATSQPETCEHGERGERRRSASGRCRATGGRGAPSGQAPR